MLVKDVMTKDVATCGPDESLHAAARVMWERDCGFVPVVDRGTGRLVGVLTDRDVCMAAYTKGMRLDAIPVRDVMTKNLKTCAPDHDLSGAESIMSEGQVRRLPVVDAKGALLGILSLNDLALEAAQERSSRAREAVAETLGRIGRHRALASV